MGSTEPQTARDGRPASNSGSGRAGNGANRLPRRRLITRVFLNERELRSGWRVVVFICLAGLILELLLAVTHRHFGASGAGSARGLFFGEVLMLVAVLASAGILTLAERRSFAEYALPWRRAFGGTFWRGVLWGAISMTALLGLMDWFHGFQFGLPVVAGERELVLAAVVFGAGFLAVGFFEEFLFRGYPLAALSQGMGFWPAAILLSAVFGAAHLSNRGESWVGGLGAGLIGLFFCLTVRRTGNLWFAIGFHGMWDFSESFIFGVPDSGVTTRRHLFSPAFHGPTWLSGGRVGPEASVFVFIVIGILFVLFHLLHPKASLETAR